MTLLQSHLALQLQRGRRGVVALASLVYLTLRISVGALLQAVLQALSSPFRRGGGGAQVALESD